MKALVPLVVVLLVAIAGVSAYGLGLSLEGASAASAKSSASISASAAASSPGLNSSASAVCMTLVRTVSSQGYAINTFLSTTSAKRGDVVCVNVILQNLDGRNLTVASDGGVSISYNITESSGVVVYENTCAETASVGAAATSAASLAPIGSWSCGGYWVAGATYNGIVPEPGTYDLVARVSVPDIVGQGLADVASTTTISLTS